MWVKLLPHHQFGHFHHSTTLHRLLENNLKLMYLITATAGSTILFVCVYIQPLVFSTVMDIRQRSRGGWRWRRRGRRDWELERQRPPDCWSSLSKQTKTRKKKLFTYSLFLNASPNHSTTSFHWWVIIKNQTLSAKHIWTKLSKEIKRNHLFFSAFPLVQFELQKGSDTEFKSPSSF